MICRCLCVIFSFNSEDGFIASSMRVADSQTRLSTPPKQAPTPVSLHQQYNRLLPRLLCLSSLESDCSSKLLVYSLHYFFTSLQTESSGFWVQLCLIIFHIKDHYVLMDPEWHNPFPLLTKVQIKVIFLTIKKNQSVGKITPSTKFL